MYIRRLDCMYSINETLKYPSKLPFPWLRCLLFYTACNPTTANQTTVVIPLTRISKYRKVSNVENVSVIQVFISALRVVLLPAIKKVSTI